MLRKHLFGLMVGAGMALAAGSASAQELTIFWAEWDPANYLQELVNEYTAETGNPAAFTFSHFQHAVERVLQ